MVLEVFGFAVSSSEVTPEPNSVGATSMHIIAGSSSRKSVKRMLQLFLPYFLNGPPQELCTEVATQELGSLRSQSFKADRLKRNLDET